MPPPNLFLPRNSGPHRIACIALYRSLLDQCLPLPLPAQLSDNGDGHNGFGKINPLKHLIRKKFRQNAHHASPKLVVHALKAGYAAEELLYAANTGSATALTQVHDLLETLHQQKIAARKACTQPPPRPNSMLKARLRAYPNAQKVVDIRPLPLDKLSGNRHVPSIAIATYLPFLRFKKTQSPYLSRVLSNKVKQKQKRSNFMENLAYEVEMGVWEGEWDDHIAEAAEREGAWEVSEELEREGWGTEGENGWEDMAASSRNVVHKNIGREFKRAGDLAERLMGVVKEERALWESERRERREAKRAAKRLERGDLERKFQGNGKEEMQLADRKEEIEAQ